MRRISYLILMLSVFAALSIQTASAQFPKIKIPKQPTPSETAQPAPANDSQPTQPQPNTRETVKPGALEGNSDAQEGRPTIAKVTVQIFTANISGLQNPPNDKHLQLHPALPFPVN